MKIPNLYTNENKFIKFQEKNQEHEPQGNKRIFNIKNLLFRVK